MSEVRLMVSGIVSSDGTKKACVRFEEGERFAEGYIPECKIKKQDGFDEEEIRQLEAYLEANLDALKAQAALVDPIRSMLTDN